MTLNTLTPSLLVVSLLSSMSLLGCQTNNLNRTAQTSAVIDDKNWSAITLKPRLFQTATKYDWQLTHVSDDKGRIKAFHQKLPLTMEVHPSLLIFIEGCQRHQVSFDMWLPLPYFYGQINVGEPSSNCIIVNNSTIENLSNKNTVKNQIGNVVDHVFVPYSDIAFRFDPITPMSAQFSNQTFKQLALKTNKGKTMIFSGTPKPEYPVAGIPLTNELLERYKWRLIRAADKTGKTISELTQADMPITATYQLDTYDQSENEPEQDYQQGAYGQSVSVRVGCNGVSGPYAISTNQTLLTGSFPSTMVSCGDAMDKIETHIRRLMLYNDSQLTLTTLDKKGISNPSNKPESSYILTQKSASGETLVWQSEEIKYFEKF